MNTEKLDPLLPYSEITKRRQETSRRAGRNSAIRKAGVTALALTAGYAGLHLGTGALIEQQDNQIKANQITVTVSDASSGETSVPVHVGNAGQTELPPVVSEPQPSDHN